MGGFERICELRCTWTRLGLRHGKRSNGVNGGTCVSAYVSAARYRVVRILLLNMVAVG